MKTNRLLLVMTFMSAILIGTNLYAQQEVDPTWYDPWGGPCGKQRDITPRTTAHRRAQESAEDGFCLARTADREAIR